MSLNYICRLNGTSPSASQLASPTSGEYENDRSDFELSPKHIDEQEVTSQEQHSLSKKEITRSKIETNIDTIHVNTTATTTTTTTTTTVRDRHSVGGILNSTTGTGTTKQSKFTFPPKQKQSAGDYPPIPPKPTVAASNARSSPTSSKSSTKSNSPSLIKSQSPKASSKSPSPDPPSPQTTSTSCSSSVSPQRGTYSRSRTIKKQTSYSAENDRFASRCATMGSQQAFHEHHKNKKRRRKSSDQTTRRFTATDSGNPSRVTGTSLLGSKFNYQFSPDMEERLQHKIEQGIQNTYGPIEKCIQAAITIQRYYRQQKMVQRFKTLRKEVISVAALQPSRPRAASVRAPTRAYSIRLKSNPEATVSILDEFPEYRKLNRMTSHSKVPSHPLQNSIVGTSKDLGPSPRLRREASLEVQETVLQVTDKSVTPVRALSVTEESIKDNVFSPIPTPSPEMGYCPSPESDPGQDTRKPSGVPFSLSVDFMTGSHEEEHAAPRPHSISIMHHITRSRSMEELLVMDNKTGNPKKPALKPQESATSLKKKTNIGITLFNRLVH